MLTTPAQKLELLQGCGLDAVVVLPFTREFATLPARDFVSGYFCERLRVGEVVIGHDYCSGAAGKATWTSSGRWARFAGLRSRWYGPWRVTRRW